MDFKSPIKAEDIYEEYIDRELNLSIDEYEKLVNDNLNNIGYESNKSLKKKETRGRKKGSGILSEVQQNEIKSFIKNSLPKDFNLNYLYWSAKSVTEFIFNKYTIKLPLSTTRDYLNSWFNFKKDSKGNQINLILTNGMNSNIPEHIKKDYENNKEILLNAKKEKAIVLLIELKPNGFIEIISKANENGFIFTKTRNKKINFFKEMRTFYENKKIYLISNNSKEDLAFLDSLLDDTKLNVYHGLSVIINNLQRSYKDANGKEKILNLFKKLKKQPIEQKKIKQQKKKELPSINTTIFEEKIKEPHRFPWDE